MEKNILITGAAVRIGSNLVRAFAKRGDNVIIHCRNSRKEAEELRKSLDNPNKHKVVVADLSIAFEAEKMFKSLGKVDILINNASMYKMLPLADSSEKSDREHFEVNFWSPLALMRAFANYNVDENSSVEDRVIVNILDQAVLSSVAKGGAYELSRRLLKEATIELAKEWAEKNIRINAIAPGPVMPPPFLPNSNMAKTISRLPLKRKVDVNDIVNGVLFLCDNSSITGEILSIDCGEHLVP